MSNSEEIVTIDGPSGVGKSTVSRVVAARLGYTYLDTGAMYRAVACYFADRGVAPDNEELVAPRLRDIHILLTPAASAEDDVGVEVNGEDVSRKIRSAAMSMNASKISALPSVRGFLTEMQRKIASQGKIVAEGRDMGTVVFPQARHKFYLEADPRERCRRRLLQLQRAGEEADEQKVLEMILERDRNDSERAVAPLKKAEDAVLVNTTALTIADVCEKILAVINERGGRPRRD